jgi:hypothetical protein
MPRFTTRARLAVARKEVIDVPVEMLTKNEPPATQSVPPTEMNAPPAQAPPRRLPGVLGNPQVRVGLLTVAALVVEAVLARAVLDVELNFFALLAPFFVFTAYKVSGQRGRTAEIVASVAVVVATATVVLVYAL